VNKMNAVPENRQISLPMWGLERRSDVLPAGKTTSQGREIFSAEKIFLTKSPLRHNI